MISQSCDATLSVPNQDKWEGLVVGKKSGYRNSMQNQGMMLETQNYISLKSEMPETGRGEGMLPAAAPPGLGQQLGEEEEYGAVMFECKEHFHFQLPTGFHEISFYLLST